MGSIFERDLAQPRKRVSSSEQVRELSGVAGSGGAGLFDAIDVGLHPYGAPGCCAEAAGDLFDESRTHLGTDLIAESGTAIRAPIHFQILTAPLEDFGEIPRVCDVDKWSVWRDLSPDPNAILGIPREAFAAPEDDIEALLARRVERTR
jgi:hypothetical protein